MPVSRCHDHSSVQPFTYLHHTTAFFLYNIDQNCPAFVEIVVGLNPTLESRLSLLAEPHT